MSYCDDFTFYQKAVAWLLGVVLLLASISLIEEADRKAEIKKGQIR